MKRSSSLPTCLLWSLWHTTKASTSGGLKWDDVNYTDTPKGLISPLTIAIRWKFVDGEIVPASPREQRMGKRPLPRFLAKMLALWHKETHFPDGDHCVFHATGKGDKPVHTANLYRDDINPALVNLEADEQDPRFANTRLRDTASGVCDKADINEKQKTNILSLVRDDKEVSPNPADAVEVRKALDDLWAALHGEETSVVTPPPTAESAPTPPPADAEDPEQARLALAAKREAAFQAYRKKHDLSVGEVTRLTEEDPSDLLKYRRNKLFPPHSEKIRRLDKFFFGDPKAT